MAGSNVKVSLSALSELKSKLSQLSGSLHEVANLMNRDLSQVGDEWRDSKYEEYKESYSEEIKNCEDIANAYEAWCKEVIDPLMERTEAAATSQVTPGGGSSVKGGSAAAGATVGGATTASAKYGFNMGGNGTSANKIVSALKNKPLSKADIECQSELGADARAVGADIQIEDITSKNSGTEQIKVESGVNLEAGAEKSIFGIKGGITSHMEDTRTAPTMSQTHSKKVNYKCEVPKK